MNKLKIPVEEFTTPDPITADRSASIEELIRMMSENGIRHIPITENGRIVGLVSDRDIKVVTGLDIKEKSQIRARDIMAKDPVSVNSLATLGEVAFEMSSRKIGSVIVNEGDKFLGIFTVTDALNALIEIERSAEK